MMGTIGQDTYHISRIYHNGYGLRPPVGVAVIEIDVLHSSHVMLTLVTPSLALFGLHTT